MRIQSVKQSPNFEKVYRPYRRPKINWSREREANRDQILRRSRSNRSSSVPTLTRFCSGLFNVLTGGRRLGS